MIARYATAAVVAVGVIVLVVEPLLPLPPYSSGTESWFGFAAVYLLTGALLGVPRFGLSEDTTFRYSVLVGAVVALLQVGLRIWDVVAARPELTIAETSFAWTDPAVFVLVVMAFMAPLGVARTRMQVAAAAAILVGIASIVTLTEASRSAGTGFGSTYAIVYYGLWFTFGVGAGLPLAVYGWTLREESHPLARFVRGTQWYGS